MPFDAVTNARLRRIITRGLDLPVHLRDPVETDTGYAAGALWRGPRGWWVNGDSYGTTHAHWTFAGKPSAYVGSVNSGNLATAYAPRRVVPGYADALLTVARQDGTTLAVSQVNGRPDLAALASHADGGALWVTQAYDQGSAAAHATQSVLAKCPRLDLSRVVDGVPAIYFDELFQSFLCSQTSYAVTNSGTTVTMPTVPTGLAVGSPVSAPNMAGNTVASLTATTFALTNAPPTTGLAEVQFSPTYRPGATMEAVSFSCKESYGVASVSTNTVTLAPHLPWWLVPGLTVTGGNVAANTVVATVNPTAGTFTLNNAPTGAVTLITFGWVHKSLDMPSGASLNARNHTVMTLMRRPFAQQSAHAWCFGQDSTVAFSTSTHYDALEFSGTQTQAARWYCGPSNNLITSSSNTGHPTPDLCYSQEPILWSVSRSGTMSAAWSGVSTNTVTLTPSTYVVGSTQTGIAVGAAATGSGLATGTTVSSIATSGSFITTVTLSGPPTGSSGTIVFGNAAVCEFDFDGRVGRITSSLSTAAPAAYTTGSIGDSQQGVPNTAAAWGDTEWFGMVAWNTKLSPAQHATAKMSMMELAGCRPQVQTAIGFVGSSITAGFGTVTALGAPAILLDMIRDVMPRRAFNIANGITVEQMIDQFSNWALPMVPYADTWVVQPGFGNSLQTALAMTVASGGSSGNVVPISSPASLTNLAAVPYALVSHANLPAGTYITAVNGQNITLSNTPSAPIAAGQSMPVINDSAAWLWTNTKRYIALLRAAGAARIYLVGHLDRGTFTSSTAPGATTQEVEFFSLYSTIDSEWRNYVDGWFNAASLGTMAGLTSATTPTPWGGHPGLYNLDRQHPPQMGYRFQQAAVAATLLATA